MKKIIVSIFILVFLASCSQKEVEKVSTKGDFFVETKLGSDFSGNFLLQKTAQVNSIQDISLNAHVNARVSSLLVKVGEDVFKGQEIAYLEDNLGNYNINVARTLNAIEKAGINRESTKLSLDTAVFNANLNLEKLEASLKVLKENSQKNILLAGNILQNSQYEGLDSQSSLELEQLDNAIARAKLDFQTNLRLDTETLNSYISQLRESFNKLAFFTDNVIEKSDNILGVTSKNKAARHDYDDLLGFRDTNQKRVSRMYLRELIDHKESDIFKEYETLTQGENLQEENMLQLIDFIDTSYNKIKILLTNIQDTLNNSIPSEGSLGQSQIDVFISQTNIHQTQLQLEQGSFILFSNKVKSFLNTYKERQASSLQAIEIQETGRDIQLKGFLTGKLNAQVNYDITQSSSQDNIQTLESQVKIARNTLDTTIKNRDIGLRSLQNTINEMQINYNSALKERGKLTIKSPIDGVITDIFIDAGQEVSSNTPLFRILSDTRPELQVSFSRDEKSLVSQGQKVYILIDGDKVEGIISTISDVADKYFNYISTIVFESPLNIIGDFVKIEIPVEAENTLIPINIITTQGNDIGLVKTLSGSSIENIRIRMGKMFGEYVELLSCAQDCVDLKIILNDVGNYDGNKFIIVEK